MNVTLMQKFKQINKVLADNLQIQLVCKCSARYEFEYACKSQC
jgi:hypothetical protein